jgi:hypothetical protein
VRIAFIAEGQTEYYCLPKIAGRLGNTILRVALVKGTCADLDWARYFSIRVVPLVRAMLLHQPEKIIVVLDRESRDDCSPKLAELGLEVIIRECGYCLGGCGVTVVISNRMFECLLFADYAALDALNILKVPASEFLPASTDGRLILGKLKGHLRRGCYYDKLQHGIALAQKLDIADENTLQRSRSLRKLVKELEPPIRD